MPETLPAPPPARRAPAAAPPRSLLDAPERHALHPAEGVRALGHVVVLAPHPDDESLGCGGLLAQLAAAGCPATVVVVTDGTRSHPGSASHPAPRLRALREAEARAAVAHLGQGARVEFLRYPDCGLPRPGTPAFGTAVRRLASLLGDLRADTLVVPWRRDPHADHEATWRLAWHARPEGVRWLEYPVWAWTRPETAPRDDEAMAWRLDVAGVLDRKRAAVDAHASQLGRVIHDDPDGFALAPDVLAHFDRPWELFLDPHDA